MNRDIAPGGGGWTSSARAFGDSHDSRRAIRSTAVVEVAIIGLGPWGLSALERLLDGLGTQSGQCREATVHVVEPGRAGSGAYSGIEQPDYFILNTPCGQHLLQPGPEHGSLPGFFEWVQARGYRWVGDRCQITSSGRAITKHDFLPRRLMGEYLEWCFGELVAKRPSGVRVVQHGEHAVDVTEIEGGERILLASGDSIDVDFVILATGHTGNAGIGSDRAPLPPYPHEAYSSAVEPQSSVAVSGMGLVAIDVVMALTRGLGGEFVGEGKLGYVPSGREPLIHMFSRTGEPYRAKSPGTEDPTGAYIPGVCTPDAVELARRRRQRETGSGRLDMRIDVLPLILAEIEVRFYEQAARLRSGEEAARAVQTDLTRAWTEGTFAACVATHEAKYGFFDASTVFFPEREIDAISSKDYEAHVYSTISDDLSEAFVRGGASPVKAAQEVLRVLRDTMRGAVEFRGLTHESYIDFQASLRPAVTRNITGPPAFRCQQLLALMDADILTTPFGPSPTVTAEAGGGYWVTSERLMEPFSKHVDTLVRGHLDDPTCDRSRSTLLQNLYRSGRICQLHYGSTCVGSIDLSEDLNPINANGEPQRRLFIVGALTEGVRYFTAYIPSPKSRVRAFIDAEACVEQILSLAS
jgi:uncharacterized NAD(P)/FAD-binding protein YdhS